MAEDLQHKIDEVAEQCSSIDDISKAEVDESSKVICKAELDESSKVMSNDQLDGNCITISKADLDESSISKADLERRGWLVVFISFFADALAMGGRALFIIIIILWEDDESISWNRTELSALMAVVHIGQLIATPLSGVAIDRFPSSIVIGGGLCFLATSFLLVAFVQTAWQVWLVYGVMCGLAYGGLNLNVFSVAVMKAVPDERAGLAVGIATSGSTFGQLALVPLFAVASRHIGWRLSFVILALCSYALVIPAVYLLRLIDDKVQKKNEQESESNENEVIKSPDNADGVDYTEVSLTDKEDEVDESAFNSGQLRAQVCRFLQSSRFIALSFSFLICGVTTTGFIESHLIAVGMEMDFSVEQGALVFSVLSACNGVAMIAAGYLSDKVDRYYLLASLFFGRALAYVLLLLAVEEKQGGGGMPVFFLFGIVFGIVDYSGTLIGC